jgi:hypothetical protein
MSELNQNDYLKNAQGALVPRELISEVDLLRDELVREIVSNALSVQKLLTGFKNQSMDDVNAFVDLSAEKYNVKMGGKKGNLTLTTYDGQYKILLAVQDTLVFDERLQVAKQLIDICIRRWAEGSRPEIHALINQAFNTDKQGKINTQRVLALRQLKIEDEEWKQAMEAISDSVQVSSSKEYLRIYERVGRTESYRQVPLDIASV